MFNIIYCCKNKVNGKYNHELIAGKILKPYSLQFCNWNQENYVYFFKCLPICMMQINFLPNNQAKVYVCSLNMEMSINQG